MVEYRCKNCNRLLFKGDLTEASVAVKCTKCGEFMTYKETQDIPDGFVEIHTSKGKTYCRVLWEENFEEKK